MSTFKSRGLRGSTFEEFINKTNLVYEENGLALIQKIPTPITPIEMDSNIYRIFCCFDNGNLVVLFNGFQKKSQKTPKDEIARAVRIMNEYFNDKNK